MIREILLQTLPQAYGLNRGHIQLSANELAGSVALSDTARCANCTTKQKPPCDKQTMRMNTSAATVILVDHESYIKQFSDAQLGKGKNCDYMLVDDSGSNYKVAFCDLTCSLAKSVEPDERRNSLPEGKRAKVMAQLAASVRRFTSKDATKAYIEGFQHRHCIFGWRDPFVSNSPVTPRRGDVDANMMIMGVATSGSEPLLLHHQEIDGVEFVFYQVKYPQVYNW
ncbi:MAG: hypothetical protein MJZ86_00760 [Bacteroidales bacterium]|nr:hypothetical protein [Bacteroidales bacterium]